VRYARNRQHRRGTYFGLDPQVLGFRQSHLGNDSRIYRRGNRLWAAFHGLWVRLGHLLGSVLP
jgi:hypothetical protein